MMKSYKATIPQNEIQILSEICGENLIGHTIQNDKVIEFRVEDDTAESVIDRIERVLHRPFRGQSVFASNSEQLGVEMSEREINEIEQGIVLSDLEIRLLELEANK